METPTELALFRIGDDAYGIDIDQIQEIDRNLSFTRVFNADAHIKGVINLRGQIVTIIDLRSKFGYEPKEVDHLSRVIVVKHQSESIGLLVDRMEDIINIDSLRLQPSSARKAGVNPEFFNGIYQLENELVIIVDVERVLMEEKEYSNG